MATTFQRISPFLWFNNEAEEAAKFYVSIFPNSSVGEISRYTDEIAAASGQKAGAAMTVGFVLDGHAVTALNGGPMFQFTEAVSLVVMCHDQAEIDHFWSKLGEGGDPNAQQCGWLKDKYGLSWQIVPENIGQYARNPKAGAAIMQMKKLDIAALEKAVAS